MSLSRMIQSGFFPGIVRWVPSVVGRNLFQLVGRFYYLVINAKERRLIRRNIRDLLRQTWHANSRDAIGPAFDGIFDHYFEKILLAVKPIAYLERFLRERVVIVGENNLAQAQARGKGSLIVTAHWGAEELIPAVLYLRGYPVSVILETATAELRATLERKAAGRDVELIFASDPGGILDKILHALARGRILVTQCDEVDAWRRRKARTIELFGHTLFFDHTIDFIARASGASVLAMYNRRLPSLRYRLVCETIAQDGSAARDIAERSLALWERYTLEAPEQWHQWKKWAAMKAI